MITAILLAAGFSQRFGSPKALAKLDRETVIERLQAMLMQSHVDEIIVVLGAHAEKIKPHLLNHTKLKVVYNKDYNFGQTSSFKVGLESISDGIKGVLLIPVDYPFIETETIDAIIRCFLDHSPLIILPAFRDKKGHPPLFSVTLKEKFLALDNQSGLNTLAHAHHSETVILSVNDPGTVKTFNTKEEFEKLRQQL